MKSRLELDYLIIGAGAAGLQLAYFLLRHGRDYLVLEAAEKPGSFWQKFPRHRQLISINKIYTGYEDRETQLRWDWNSLLCDDDEMSVSRYSKRYFLKAGDYAKYLEDFAQHFGLNIRCNTRVVKISKNDRFTVLDDRGNVYTSRCLTIATGVSKPYIPDIPGIELTENYFNFPFDADDYINQRVLIIGKGTSGFETANHLIETARVIHLCNPHSIQFAWKTHFVGHLRAINTPFLDTYVLKGQNSVLDASIEKIEYKNGEDLVHIVFSNADSQQAILAYDRVLCCTGFRFDSAIFDDSCQPELAIDNKFPAMTSEWESLNVQDMYFAGTLMQVRDFHKTHSNVIHGFRFNIKALSHIWEEKYHGKSLPYQELPLKPQAIVDKAIARVSTSAAIFLQQGFLCDLIVICKSSQTARYYEGFPVDYVRESDFAKQEQYYTITMEFGHVVGDPFSVKREKDQDKAYLDVYLHPIIRRFSGAYLFREHHVAEHLENDWRPGQHHPGLIDHLLHWQQRILYDTCPQSPSQNLLLNHLPPSGLPNSPNEHDVQNSQLPQSLLCQMPPGKSPCKEF
ncbi:MAG: NAD(P)-binding domain-containing protein [Hormoscilla sp. GM7CHS1pb]|nr:NAD(P)-binding domain-containing protein [Hormoscilla sp. GM7CHS1pb]